MGPVLSVPTTARGHLNFTPLLPTTGTLVPSTEACLHLVSCLGFVQLSLTLYCFSHTPVLGSLPFHLLGHCLASWAHG